MIGVREIAVRLPFGLPFESFPGKNGVQMAF
jgi:hypothetical protein